MLFPHVCTYSSFIEESILFMHRYNMHLAKDTIIIWDNHSALVVSALSCRNLPQLSLLKNVSVSSTAIIWFSINPLLSSEGIMLSLSSLPSSVAMHLLSFSSLTQPISHHQPYFFSFDEEGSCIHTLNHRATQHPVTMSAMTRVLSRFHHFYIVTQLQQRASHLW